MIEVKNFIDEGDLDKLLDPMPTNMFPWYYKPYAVDETVKAVGDFISAPVFRHNFFRNGEPNSNFFFLVTPVLDAVCVTLNTDRIKIQSVDANFVMPMKEFIGKQVYAHRDYDHPQDVQETHNCYTALLYLHDCDGETVFYKKEGDFYVEDFRVMPEKNKFVCWDNDIYHSAPAAASKERFVLNMNFLVEKDTNNGSKK